MTEVTETPVNVDKEPGAVKRVAERITTFLKETYTLKGATAKEVTKYNNLYASFTPAQREELIAFNEKAIHKTAMRKVVRNWIITGAGLAAGWSIATGGLPAMWAFLTKTAPIAIGTGLEAVRTWMFDPHKTILIDVPNKLSDIAKNIGDFFAKGPGLPSKIKIIP